VENYIEQSMQLIGRNSSVQICHADFEKSAHIAVLQSFPQCENSI